MAQQAGSYDFKAAKAAHDEAAQVATNYIFKSTGHDAWVCDEDAGPDMSTGEAYGPDAAKPTTGWRIGGVFDLVRSGLSWFRLWLDQTANKVMLRLGLETSGHIVLDDTGMDVLEYDSTSQSISSRAKFGSTVRIGKEYDEHASDNESHMELDYHSMQFFDADGVRYFHVSDLRDHDGFIVETFTAPGGTNVFSLMALPSTNPQGWATIDGEPATVYNFETSSQRCSVSPTPEEGAIVVIGYKPGSYRFTKAFTFGYRKADEQVGAMSFCEGLGNAARGEASHAEGENNIANGWGAHAEGARCTALGNMAHAEGYSTLAVYAAHAEGQDTTASHIGSHSQNVGTEAAKMAQTALGSYNVADSASTTTHPSGTNNYGQYAVIVGNGTSDDDRSNALAVDWNGNALIAGEVQDMSGNAKYANASHTHSYLPLSGGTVTGNITTESSANTCFMAKHDYLDAKQANNGITETRWPAGAQVKDKNGLLIANFCTSVYTSGVVGASIYAYNYNTSGTQVGSGHINLMVDKSGNVTYDVTTPQAFRNAIGIGAYGALTGMSADVNLSGTAASSAKKIPFTSFTGAYCSASSGGIKVAQAGVYMIWATPYFTTGITQNDLIHALIYKNSSAIYDHHQRIGTYEQVNVGPIIQTLAANDTIYVYAYNQAAARGKVGNIANGGLFVKRIA